MSVLGTLLAALGVPDGGTTLDPRSTDLQMAVDKCNQVLNTPLISPTTKLLAEALILVIHDIMKRTDLTC